METEMRLEDIRFSIDKHPCFSEKARHRFGRIHLPVAPACKDRGGIL